MTSTIGTRPGPVNVKLLHAYGDGVTDDTEAIEIARTVAKSGGRALYFPYGTYLYEQPTAAGLVIDWSHAEVLGDPGTVIKFTGNGKCLSLDGGASGAITNVRVSNLIISGNYASLPDISTVGIYCRSLHRSVIRDCRVINADEDALLGEFMASCTIENFVCSGNDDVIQIQPNRGIRLTRRGAGENSTGNTIVRPVIEGLYAGTGIYLDWCDKTVVVGGTSQGNDRGVHVTANGGSHVFLGLWGEANLTDDFFVDTFFTDLVACKGETLVRFGPNSYACALRGGEFKSLTIDENTGVADQAIDLDRVALLNANGNGTLTDNGRRTRRRFWYWPGGHMLGSVAFSWAPTIAAGDYASTTVVATGVKVGDRLLVGPTNTALPDGVTVQAHPSASDAVRVVAVNHTGAPVTLAGYQWILSIP